MTVTGVTATLTGSTLRAGHAEPVDPARRRRDRACRVPLDYGFATTRTTSPSGVVETVGVPFGTTTPPASVRAYLMVDAYPAATETLPHP